MYTIAIPVKPFVNKYIFARYQSLPWEIDKNDLLGKYVYNMLERLPRKNAPRPPEMGASLSIGISYRYANHKGLYLSTESILDFNDMVRLALIEEIRGYLFKLRNGVGLKKYDILFVNQTSSAGIKKRRAIKDPSISQYFEIKEIVYDIFRQYDINEDDYPFENIKKDIQRLKLPLLCA